MPRARAEAKPESRLRRKDTKESLDSEKKRSSSPAAVTETRTSKRQRVETAKPAAKPVAKPTTKAAAAKPASKPAPKAAEAPAANAKPKAVKPLKAASSKIIEPDLNPLPKSPVPSRPALTVFIWGASDSGQLGLGERMDEVPRPKPHPWVKENILKGTFGTEPGAGIVTVTSGGLHTYLLDEAGNVWSSGTNDEGALGRETKKDPSDNEPDLRANHYAVIKGLNDDEFRATRLAAGDNFGAALGEKGELKVWGTFRDDEGKSSFSSDVKKQLLPTSVSVLGRTTARSRYDPISSITGGENHLVALTTRGEVYSWGIGGSGQLGRRVLVRHKQDALVPQRVVLGIRARKAVLIGAGLRATFAVDEAGEVWAWGMNSVGQLGIGERGDGVSQPTRLPVLSPANLDGDRVVQVEGGEFHTLFLTEQGRVYACGACNDFQLGIPEEHEAFGGKGTRGAECVAEPVLVPLPAAVEGDPVVGISCGPRYNMAVTKEGVLLSWGVGLQGCGEEGGQLGG
ncbi:RCC1 domain-containing protein [Coprinopsis marcescibilis]|uniref:RCC1 domain-containing protein n=1 Tax=Coprinopsis marcescibilis TaxID=230819 RepID=A0A5C3KVT1_COPMA|nr:RCC1 domain-containing protein [Coprinopsis marcescibilis]